MNETDTCRTRVEPKLRTAGWECEPHSYTEQFPITAGQIIVVGNKAPRKRPKFADYLLRYPRNMSIAVVEAKSHDKLPGHGLEQAKEYALLLGLKFAYSTNRHGI